MSQLTAESVRLRSTDGPLPADAFRVRLVAEMPPQVPSDTVVELDCTVENLGRAELISALPHPVHLAYRWLHGTTVVPVAEAHEPRFALPRPLQPGESLTCSVRVSTPSVEGEYVLSLTLVQEDVAWFDDVDASSACRQIVRVHKPWPLAELDAAIRGLSSREAEVRGALLAACEHLERGEPEIQTPHPDLGAGVPERQDGGHENGLASPAAAETPGSDYRQLIGEIRQIVSQAIPPGAIVAVLSKGDAELLRFDGRMGWHFPRNDAGVYVGHHPADSAEAIAHLEVLRAKGVTDLLVPATSLWWLDHYVELRQHLDASYRRVWADARCVIYHLIAPEIVGGNGHRQTPWERVRRLFARSGW